MAMIRPFDVTDIMLEDKCKLERINRGAKSATLNHDSSI